MSEAELKMNNLKNYVKQFPNDPLFLDEGAKLYYYRTSRTYLFDNDKMPRAVMIYMDKPNSYNLWACFTNGATRGRLNCLSSFLKSDFTQEMWAEAHTIDMKDNLLFKNIEKHIPFLLGLEYNE